MSDKPIKVLFVGGYGRSGSTVIDLLLNRVPGVVAVGEFRHLFGRALGDNELCSCGKPFRDCNYWQKVMTEAFPNGYNRNEIQAAIKTFNTLRSTPELLIPSLMNPGLKKRAEVYSDAVLAVYRAVAKISGASVVVDSSKYPMHGLFIRSIPGIELKTMLLTRDPRAVAYSWQRHRIRPEVHWEKREMPRHGVLRSALAWNASNLLTGAIDKDKDSFRLQKYEDFIDNPRQTIQEIASFALGRQVNLGEDLFGDHPEVPHTIAGNPVRIGSKQITVRPDSEWSEQLAPTKKMLISAFCARQMRQFDYRFKA